MASIPGLPDFSLGSIFCIGRNYPKHARELNNMVPDEPMVFLKPVSSVITSGETIQLPRQSQNVHHEVELVVVIGKKGRHISHADAYSHIAAYGVGIDVTARDLQQKAKKQRHPWSVAKGFDTFAPISNFERIKETTDLGNMELSLQVNGSYRQQGHTENMYFGINDIIAHLSSIFTLHPGDLIFTGTPEGVSQIKAGDSIRALLNDGEKKIELTANVRNESA